MTSIAVGHNGSQGSRFDHSPTREGPLCVPERTSNSRADLEFRRAAPSLNPPFLAIWADPIDFQYAASAHPLGGRSLFEALPVNAAPIVHWMIYRSDPLRRVRGAACWSQSKTAPTPRRSKADLLTWVSCRPFELGAMHSLEKVVEIRVLARQGHEDQGDRWGDRALAEHGPEVLKDGEAAVLWPTGTSANEAGALHGLLEGASRSGEARVDFRPGAPSRDSRARIRWRDQSAEGIPEAISRSRSSSRWSGSTPRRASKCRSTSW